MAEITLEKLYDLVLEMRREMVTKDEFRSELKDAIEQSKTEIIETLTHDFNDVIDAQNRYMDAQFSAINARFELFRQLNR